MKILDNKLHMMDWCVLRAKKVSGKKDTKQFTIKILNIARIHIKDIHRSFMLIPTIKVIFMGRITVCMIKIIIIKMQIVPMNKEVLI